MKKLAEMVLSSEIKIICQQYMQGNGNNFVEQKWYTSVEKIINMYSRKKCLKRLAISIPSSSEQPPFLTHYRSLFLCNRAAAIPWELPESPELLTATLHPTHDCP